MWTDLNSECLWPMQKRTLLKCLFLFGKPGPSWFVPCFQTIRTDWQPVHRESWSASETKQLFQSEKRKTISTCAICKYNILQYAYSNKIQVLLCPSGHCLSTMWWGVQTLSPGLPSSLWPSRSRQTSLLPSPRSGSACHQTLGGPGCSTHPQAQLDRRPRVLSSEVSRRTEKTRPKSKATSS